MTSARVRDDRGVTLVELIVYVSIAALFSGLLAYILVTALQVDRETRERDIATTRAQTLVNTITRVVRNSAEFEVETETLRTRVASADGGWECLSWHREDNEIVRTDSTPGRAVSSTVALAGVQDFTIAQSVDRLEFSIRTQVGEQTVEVSGSAVRLAKAKGGTTCF